MQPAFGMAEACTCMTYDNELRARGERPPRFLKSSLGRRARGWRTATNRRPEFIDLGPPIPGVQIRITDEQNGRSRRG